MAKGFMDEDPGQPWIQDHGILATFHWGSGEQSQGTLAYLAYFFMLVFNRSIGDYAAQAVPGLLDYVTIPRHRSEGSRDINSRLLDE
jgi:hypothetical protein